MKLSSIGYLTKEGLHNIWNNRMMSLASVVVLVSCLIITAAAALMSVNVSTLIGQLGDDNEMTVYLLPEVSDLDSIELGIRLGKIQNVESYRYITRDKVLEQYEKQLGEEIYQSLQDGRNPFGNEFRVRLRDLSQYDNTVSEIKSLSGVDTVSDRKDVASKLTKLNYFVTIVGSWVVLILAVVTLFIISNTIKMTMYSRRFEISIMKSVGATNAFVRIPFLIEAMMIGLLSGVIAALAIIIMYSPIRDAAAGVIGMIGNATLPVERIWLPTLLLMSGAGIAIGLIGGFISVTRYLNKEGGSLHG